jgi:cardiolipin-specific phospholipase
MGKWALFNPSKLEEIENKLIDASGVEFKKHKVMVDPCNYLYCLTCGDESKPPLVVLHGFGGAGMIFFKVVKQLTARFRIYFVDHLGMGRSTRPTFTPKTHEEAEVFFVEPIERLRIHFNLSKFVLAGHSFGGYIAGCYTLRHSEHVEKLLFLSSVGIPEAPKNYDFVKELKGTWDFRLRERVTMWFWVRNITPLHIFRLLGPWGHNFMQMMFGHRIMGITEDETKLIISYLEQLSSLPGSGEYAIIILLSPGSWARNPLVNRIHELKVPMAFCFGDRDWVRPDGAHVVKEKSEGKVLIYTLHGSDHHMYWDNPHGLAENIIQAVDDLDD